MVLTWANANDHHATRELIDLARKDFILVFSGNGMNYNCVLCKDPARQLWGGILGCSR